MRLMPLLALAVMGSVGCTEGMRPSSVSVTDSAADSTAGELPFRWAGPVGTAVVVPVRINGRDTVDLILDTGATMTCIDTALATELALPEQRAMVGAAVGIGGAGRVRLHFVDSLQIGPAVARDLTVCAMDLQALRAVGGNARGLLGLNVLRSFRVTLDFERKVLRLAPAVD
jgi:hypothetical protein